MAAAEQLIAENLEIWSPAVQTKSAAGRGRANKPELYGIKKLRQLILGAALAGGFSTDEEEFDQPVPILLQKARESYSKSTRRKLRDFEQGDPLITEFKLPSNWRWVRVADLCDLQTGATPSRQKPEFFGGDLRWLVSGDINMGEIDDCNGRITEEGLASSNCKILPVGTVLIALNGQGKTRATVAHLNVEAACNQSLVGMIPFDREVIDSRFLLLALRHRYYEIREITGQKQRRGLNMALVAQLSVPLPPIDSQKSIVAKVEELMALCDQLEQQQESSIAAHQTLVQTLLDALTTATDRNGFTAAWARIAEHFDTLFTNEWSIDQLKQTILQLAVMGKLVPQDASDEPARELLKKVAAEKTELINQKKIRSQKKLPAIEADEKPFELPAQWTWARLEAAVIQVTDGEHLSPEKSEAGVKLLTAKHVRDDGVTTDDPQYVSSEDAEKFLLRCRPEMGDVLICSRGTIGRCCVNEVSETYCLMGSVILLKKSEYICSRYLNYFIKSSTGQLFIRGVTKGMAVNALYLKDIKLCPTSIPPLEEQKRIVAKVDELMALCESLKSHHNTARSTQLKLADAMAAQAIA